MDFDDEIRAAEDAVRQAERALEVATVRLDTWRDARLAARRQAAPAEPAAKRPRMDIAAAILRLLGDRPHSEAELAAALARKPGQIDAALRRLVASSAVRRDGATFCAIGAAEAPRDG